MTISDITLASSLLSQATLPPAVAAAVVAAGTTTNGSIRPRTGTSLSTLTTRTTRTLQLPTAQVVGNPSDVAIFNFIHGLTSVEQLRAERPLIHLLPFNSRNKYMLSIHAVPPSRVTGSKGYYVAYLKGAPEIVLSFCGTAWVKGENLPLSASYRQTYDESYKEVAGQGERVLGLAMRVLPPALFPYPSTTKADFKAREEELLSAAPAAWGFLGLFSLVDPPKPKVDEAVQACKKAGVRVAMVTGDHPLTAEAIARKVRIIHDFATQEEIASDEQIPLEDVREESVGAMVMNCQKAGLQGWVEEDWEALLDKPELVFARASPHDKLLIVQALRRRGEVVAVTGDGVNDSPALKNADVGVAMGVGGSEVAKHAANVVLMDDDFASIVHGVEEGRVLFDNLTKTIAYTLAHAVPELVAVVIHLVFRVPVGLTSLMILSIDMLTEIAPAVSFAWEPAESNVMLRPPRDRGRDRLVRPSLLAYAYLQAGVLETLVCLGAYAWVFAANGVRSLSSLQQVAREEGGRLATMGATAFYVSLIVAQAFHAFAVKTRVVSLRQHGVLANPMMVYGVLVALGLMCFFAFVPGVSDAFGAYPSLAVQYFMPALLGGMVLVLGGEGRKGMLRRHLREGTEETSWLYKCFAW
jgi:sodium/potassium-transporting ATPase subunit alpha